MPEMCHIKDGGVHQVKNTKGVPISKKATSLSGDDKTGVSEPKNRSNPVFIVEIDGEDFRDNHYISLVESVTVEDTLDKIPVCRVVFNNAEERFTNDPLWNGNKEMRVYTGYPNVGIEAQVGTFITRPARQKFGNSMKITVDGWGQQVKMDMQQKRRVFSDMNDSEIAESIAGEYGFDTDIESTDKKFKHVTQANTTDINFLIKRAKQYGFLVYVRNNVFHFHPPRYESSGTTLWYRKGTESSLKSFAVSPLKDMRTKNLSASQIDPKSHEIFTVENNEVNDDISKQSKSNFDGDVDEWQSLMQQSDVPSGYLVNKGQNQSKSFYQQFVNSRYKASKWILKGKGGVIGLENLQAGQTINLQGIGRWGGEYLLTKVFHDMRKGGYKINFEVMRTWTGTSKKPETKSGTSQANSRIHSDGSIVKAGEVSVA